MIDTTELRKAAEEAIGYEVPPPTVCIHPATILELLDEREKLLKVAEAARPYRGNGRINDALKELEK